MTLFLDDGDVRLHHQRHAIGIELNEAYCKIAARQLQQLSLLT